MDVSTTIAAAAGAQSPLTVDAVYDETSDFVWRNLQRMGVPSADLEDVMQEVFVVVHRKLDTYDRSCRLTTWVFGICLRVASRHRAKAQRRREVLMDNVPEAAHHRDPEAAADERQRLEHLNALLDALPPDKRATFVMFELERISCDEIAELMSVPVGTVYSRLHAVRRTLRAAMRGESSDATGKGEDDDGS